MLSGIYPATAPQLSAHEAALLATLPAAARTSRPASHAELRASLVAMAERGDHELTVETTDFGFTAVVARQLRVVAHVRGDGDETFYCQGDNAELLRELGEEIARVCGPQLLLPVSGDSEGVLVVARS